MEIKSLTLNGTKYDSFPDLVARQNGGGGNASVNYVENKTVYLGVNVLGDATLGAGWTASGGVYTHAAGASNTADLTFATTVEDGAVYLLEFDTTFTNNEFVCVGIGDQYRVQCYQGKSHITVPLLASGGTTLYFTPMVVNSNTFAGSISNITLRKIQDSGTECLLDIYNTTTANHTKNYGFWNTFIGENTAENAVGSTRSIAIGYYTLNALQGGHRNIGIGTFAMSQMKGGEENISIGSDSMLEVQKAEGCVAIGMGAMYLGGELKDNIAIGKSALYGAAGSTINENVAIGYSAGYKCKTDGTAVARGNAMIGARAGYNIETGYNNVCIGSGATGAATGGMNTAIGAQAGYTNGKSCSVAIGYGAMATKSNQVVIGKKDGSWGSVTETLLGGDIIVRCNDNVNRKILFNEDGTCKWEVAA